ncbi:MAG: hypothetical protein K8R41_00510 [Bacteroidales bacterium]|nr:hypothetical protein [Bacteroidales bacterium]
MNFQQSKKHLQAIFKQNNFEANAKHKNLHSSQVIVETCSNGTEISISFPGYKAYISDNKTVYDYRVDINKNGIKTSLSHTNIITDIYNKIVNGKMSNDNLKVVLIKVAQEGNIDLQAILSQLPYNSVIPPHTLIKRVKNAHNSKGYNQVGNSFDLTVEELLYSIKWIVLQEDINYPITNNFEGRKMPFARYLETVFITQNNSHRIEEVISRALSHSRPKQWQEMDYLFANLIV